MVNRLWRRDETRMKNYTSIKQELVEQEVKECTFTPHMVALEKSKRILRSKQLRENQAREMDQDKLNYKDLVPAKF